MSTAREYYKKFLEWPPKTIIKGVPAAHVHMPFLGTDGMLTIARELRGADNICIDMMEDSEYFHELMEYLTEATIIRQKAWRKYLGEPEVSDWIGFADDSILLLSTDMYEEFVLPYNIKLKVAISTGKVTTHPPEPLWRTCGQCTRPERNTVRPPAPACQEVELTVILNIVIKAE